MAGTYENQVSTDPESFFSVQERRDSRDHWRPVGNSRRPYTEEFRNELVTNACLWHEATGYDYRIVRTIREVEFETS